jgi:hypothetical protein
VVPKAKPDRIVRMMATELRVGDIIIVVEEEARGNLFDRVVEIAEDQPDLHYLRTYRKEWQGAMETLKRKYDIGVSGFTQLLTDLRLAGSSISTELSVRNWVQGRVMGPDDVSSIKAVGEISGIENLKRNPTDYDAAFRLIRGLHQGLGRRLTGAIREAAGTLIDVSDTNSNVFGEYVWLPLNELLETVDFAEITGIVDQAQRIAAYRTGRIMAVA